MKYTLLLAIAIGCHAQSIQSITVQIQKTPTASLYVDRGSAYLAVGDARQAVADADRALDRDALNIRALILHGQANTKLGRHSDAITDFSSAIALTPTDSALYVARSAAYAAAGDQRRSAEDREEALRLDPRTVAALDRQPPAVAAAPVVPERIAVVSAPAPVPPTPAKATPIETPRTAATTPKPPPVVTADAHYQRGKDLLNLGKNAEGLAELNEAIRLEPRNPIFYNTRGYGYHLARDYKRAIQEYDEALRLNPNYLNALHNRALARRGAGDTAGYAEDRQREIELGKKLGIPVQ